MESMMTVRQVAELLGVHENWVYDQAASGELPSYKIGGTRRFDPDELRGWIAERRQAERDEPRGAVSRPNKQSRPKAGRRAGPAQPTLFE
jgi:excisionase family DNA binding protein